MTNLKSFLALALGTFALGIAEFGMMGILSDVAVSLDIDIDKAGQLISAYSTGVAVGAPLLVFMRRMPLRSLLLLLAAVITAGNAAAALAPGYGTLLAARFIAGLPHGAFFGAGAIVCTRLAKGGTTAGAVAVMIGGMTVANVIGVPAATFISTAISWRFAFAVVALFGLLSMIAIRGLIPRLAPLPDTGFKGQFRFLRSPIPWYIYGGVFFGQAAAYCWLSYISPLMMDVTGFSASDMTWIMMVTGCGMVFGNMMAGRLAGVIPPARVSLYIAALMILLMPAIYLAAPVKWLSVLLAFAGGALLFGIGCTPQAMIVKYSKGGEMLGGAGIQIAFNVSNAMSAAVGGLVISLGYGYTAPALAGIPFAIVGLLCFLLLSRSIDPRPTPRY